MVQTCIKASLGLPTTNKQSQSQEAAAQVMRQLRSRAAGSCDRQARVPPLTSQPPHQTARCTRRAARKVRSTSDTSPVLLTFQLASQPPWEAPDAPTHVRNPRKTSSHIMVRRTHPKLLNAQPGTCRHGA